MCLKPLAKRSSNEVLLLRINTLLLQHSGLYMPKNFCSGTYAKLSFYGHDQAILLRVTVDPFFFRKRYTVCRDLPDVYEVKQELCHNRWESVRNCNVS